MDSSLTKAVYGMACFLFSCVESAEGMLVKSGSTNNLQDFDVSTPMNLDTRIMNRQERQTVLTHYDKQEKHALNRHEVLRIMGERMYFLKRWRFQTQLLQRFQKNKQIIEEIMSQPVEYRNNSELNGLVAENQFMLQNYPRLILNF